jgi:hypothetical protein
MGGKRSDMYGWESEWDWIGELNVLNFIFVIIIFKAKINNHTV